MLQPDAPTPHPAHTVNNDRSSGFRGTPGEEPGGHLPVGAEAFPPATSHQPREPASLTWCQYTGSPAAEGI